MAFSKSVQKAQTFAVCQFCEESPDIKWKCINCDLFLCQLCNSRIHSKSETLAEHKRINLKECGTEVATETIRKEDLQKLSCSDHNEQKCCVFCENCDRPICSQCLIETHQNHKFSDLKSTYQKKISDIKDLKTKIETNLPFYQNEKDKLQNMLSTAEKEFIENKSKILQQEKAIIEAAKKYAQELIQELIQELETQWKPSEDQIKKELIEITRQKNELETRKNNLDQALSSHQASDIFTTSASMDKTLPTKSTIQVKLNKSKFIPEDISKLSRSETFGDIYNIPEIDLVNTYTTRLPSIVNVLLNDSNTAFISSLQDEKLKKIKCENNQTKVESEVKIEVYNMAMMPNGDIIISNLGGDLIIYSQGQVKNFKTFAPLYSLGIYVNKYNDILVGLTDSAPFKTPSKDSIRRVVSLNQTGDIQHTYEFDRNNQRLFTWPHRIISYNDNIYVIDILRDILWEGRVIAINLGGQLQWTYSGHSSINTGKGKFYPRDMIITSTGLLVISDRDNHALHLLTNKGEVILCRIVKDIGIELPYSLNIDKKGLLWVGCGTLTESKTAMIHILTLK